MKHIGKSYPIHDAVGKASGKIKYAGDMEFQGMCHMAVLFSPIPHGYVKSIDCSKALSMDGVIDVIHCFNTTNKKFNRYHSQYRQELIHNECIFNSHVRFVGDRVAAVIATTEEIARAAVKLIEVEYEEAKSFAKDMFDTLEGKADGTFDKVIYDQMGGTIGDPTAFNQEGLVSIKTVTDLSRINHVCMETHAAICDYDYATGSITIYSPNQTVYGIRSFIGELFEMDYSKIRVVKTTMGGSFGGKQEWVLEPLVAAAALRVKRPVRLVYNRSETMVSTYGRSPMHFESEYRFTPDGKLQGCEVDFILDAGAYTGNSINYANTLAHKFFRGYNYPYRKINTKATITNSIVNGAFRGWTAPEMTIMFEHNMNMAARALNMDPIDLRLKNVMKPGDIDPAMGQPIGEIRGKEVLLRGREVFDWDRRKEEIKKFNEENKRYKRGLGVGYGGHVNGFFPAKADFARVEMRLTESGSVQCNVTLHDHGCGTVTAFKMIVAEELGLTLDQVQIKEGDTDSTPMDFGCFSSRTVHVIGRATVDCAKKFKEKLKEHVAILENCTVEELVVENQRVYSTLNSNINYTWSDLAHKSHQVYQHEVFVSHDYVNHSNPGVAGAHFAMVEVDTYTGMTKILDYLAVHDIGQAINREMCIAQTQGAVIMGSGAALSEHIVIREDGKPTSSLKDYHLINSFEAPNVRVELIEDHLNEGPYGAKSIGEACHVPVTACVVGAVNDALQSDMNHIPLNPDRIVKYLRAREEKSC